MLGGFISRNLLLAALEAGQPQTEVLGSWFSDGGLCVLTWRQAERDGEGEGERGESTHTHTRGSASWSHHLPSPNTASRRIRVSVYELWGDANIQCIAGTNLVFTVDELTHMCVLCPRYRTCPGPYKIPSCSLVSPILQREPLFCFFLFFVLRSVFLSLNVLYLEHRIRVCIFLFWSGFFHSTQ